MIKELRALRDNPPPSRDPAQAALADLTGQLDMDGLVLDRNDAAAELIVDGELPMSLNSFHGAECTAVGLSDPGFEKLRSGNGKMRTVIAQELVERHISQIGEDSGRRRRYA